MKNVVVRGSFFVALGACCYGMLGSFVKMAYLKGYSTAEVTLAQFGLGFAGLCILNLIRKPDNKYRHATKRADLRSKIKLIVAGSSLGLTSISYYMAVRYIPVSIGIVLLMQMVWMSVLLEVITLKRSPGIRKIIAALIVIGGTILATNIFERSVHLSWLGFGWGLSAAVFYTATIYSSNNIELHLPPVKRSFYMISGGLIIVILAFHSAINHDFSYRIFMGWGLLVAVFGTILPPLLLTKGIPLTGIGLGAILAAIEIPIAVLAAHILLREPVSLFQWIGIICIFTAVIFLNLRNRTHSKPDL